MKFSHPSFDESGQHIEAMNWVKNSLKRLNIPGKNSQKLTETFHF
jgi:hypothetical protein